MTAPPPTVPFSASQLVNGVVAPTPLPVPESPGLDASSELGASGEDESSEVPPASGTDEPLLEEVLEAPLLDEPLLEEPLLDEPPLEEPLLDEPPLEELLDEPPLEEPLDEPPPASAESSLPHACRHQAINASARARLALDDFIGRPPRTPFDSSRGQEVRGSRACARSPRDTDETLLIASGHS
jgi:hypothetical protein